MKRVGLFVGVNQYRDKGINNLSCAVNDATALSQYFSGKGYETFLMTDGAVSAANVCAQISEISKSLETGDVFLFYFSGHGHEFGDNHYLLCPAASTATLDINGGIDAIPLAAVRRLSEDCTETGIRRLFILDCCRDNVRAGAKSAVTAANGKGIALVAEDHNDGILPPWILRSCQAGQRSFEDTEKGHGFFTLALGETLADEAVKSFSAFFERLTGNMRHFIHPDEQRITLGEYSGGNFPLFDTWELEEPASNTSPESVSASPGSPSGSVFSRTLTTEERTLFYTLQEEVKKIYTARIVSRDFPARMQELLSKSQRALEKLKDATPSSGALDELNVLKNDLLTLQESLRQMDECGALKKQCDLETVSLKKLNLPLPESCSSANAAAEEAMEKEDWEAALPLWQDLHKQLLAEKEKINDDYMALARELNAARALGIIFSDDNTVITGCSKKDISTLVIPRSVTTIGNGAFRGCYKLYDIEIPEGVTTIGQSAFEGITTLLSVKLPASLTHIGKWAFARCTNLINVQFKNEAVDFNSEEGKMIFEGCPTVNIGVDEEVLKTRRRPVAVAALLALLVALGTAVYFIFSGLFS